MLTWIVDGVEYPLDTGVHCYCQGMDGLGMMPVSRIEESGPLQHGSTDRGYRLNARTISLALLIFGNSKADLWLKRNALVNMFKPGNTPGILRWTLGAITREITGFFADGLNLSSKDISGWSQKTGVMIRCNDPAWYDPVAKTAAIIASVGTGSGGEVPSAVPTDVGSSGLNATTTIHYSGDVTSYPKLIRITGPITSCVITNLATGEKLDFAGKTIALGDHYDIDLRYGYKTVKNASGVNKNADLSADSDLTTWGIYANPDVPEGENSIQATGSGVDDGTRIDITYYDRYSGI